MLSTLVLCGCTIWGANAEVVGARDRIQRTAAWFEESLDERTAWFRGSWGPSGLACTCATKLPEGRVLGDVAKRMQDHLAHARADQMDLNQSGLDGDPNAAVAGAFAAMAWPSGSMDSKNTMRGQAPSESLGDAGNFVYYAVGSGYLPTSMLDAGAGAYALYAFSRGQKSWASLTGRMFSDSSAASVRDEALKGCS